MTQATPDRAIILESIREILADVVEDPDLVLDEPTKAEDVPDWDSVNHVKLIIALESEFGIRFNPDEINSLKQVGDLIDLISREVGHA